MIQKIQKQTLVSDNRLVCSRGNSSQLLFRSSLAAITTLGMLFSTPSWADTKSYEFAGFDGVSASEGIHMQVTKGDTFKVIAESDDPEQLGRLELDIKRGILGAQMDYPLFSFDWTEKKKVTVRVTMPSLVQAETSTGAKVEADAVSGSAVDLSAYSGSSIIINAIDGGAMSVDVSNGSEIQIANGTCASLSACVSGGAFLDMENVGCAAAAVDASTGSHVSVFADKSIDADASSGSRIRIYGTQEKTKIDVSSGGKIDFK